MWRTRVVLRLLLVISFGAGIACVKQIAQDDQRQTAYGPMTRAEFEAALVNRVNAVPWRELRDNFPDDYRRIVDRLYDLTPELVNAEGIGIESQIELALFMERQKGNAARAPAPLLIAIAAEEVAFVDKIDRENRELCKYFAILGVEADSQLSILYPEEVSRRAARRLEAARAGRLTPRTEWKPHYDGEYDKLWFGGLDQIKPRTQCQERSRNARAVALLPPEFAAHMEATFLSENIEYEAQFARLLIEDRQRAQRPLFIQRLK